ncbi:MAG: fimbrillin family protein, partial [Prevotella sp.]|nr:fimbrillin family protein [Prevotella sp.]
EFLKAEETGQSSQQTVNLTFKHQMAKVMCRVKDADGRYIRGAKVRFYGMPSVTFDKGAVTATGTRGEITPYSIDEVNSTTYVALLAPQTIASGESFIEVAANGKTYRFKPTDNIELKAGKSYNYKITIGDKVDYTIDDNGTYYVYTAEGLNAWTKAASASPYNASCTLENNIELTGENNWMPVCQSRDNPYTGTFDGNGKSISGLNISSDASYVGFIGRLGEGGAVKNLTLEVANMSSTGSSAIIGAVAGSNIGTISDCHVINSTISGKFRAGGVAGINNGTVSYCHVSDDCSVKGESDSFLFLGGIAGQNESSGKITACYVLCSLSVTGLGSKRVGGVFGSSTGSCTACYSCCKLLGAPDYAGGISGNNPGTVTACYWANVPNATNVFGKGIGNGTDNTVKVDGSTVTWSAAAEEMNKALGADCGHQYEVNGDSQTEPLKLVEKQ